MNIAIQVFVEKKETFTNIIFYIPCQGISPDQKLATYPKFRKSPFEDKIGNLYIVGPVCVASNKEERSGLYRYRKKHQLTQRYLNIPQMTILELANVLSMSVYAICGQEIEETELIA